MTASYAEQLKVAMQAFVPSSFSHLPVRGSVCWTPQRLTWIGMLMAWGEGPTLATRWEQACHLARSLHTHWQLGQSFTGFTNALVRESPTLVQALKQRFHRIMR